MNASVYTGAERRQTTRTIVGRIAYIHLGPNNGGILSNISEGGLCFHAASPVQVTEPLRFWFLAEGRRIEADGKLAWTDEAQKAGGLRFNSQSSDIHKQVLDWIRKSTTLSTTQGQWVPPVPKVQALRDLRASRLHRNSAPDHPALLPEFPAQRKAELPGFFRGLLTGLLIAALLATALLLHTYRRQFGESLVHLGERLGGKTTAKTASQPAVPIPLPRPERPAIPLSGAVESQTAKRKPAAATAPSPISPVPSAGAAVALSSILVSHELGKFPQLEPADPKSSDAPMSQLESAKSSLFLALPEPVLLAQPEAANRSARESRDLPSLYANSSAGKYFEVGKFRDGFRANQATNELGQLGLHAIIIHSRVLWMNSYHILVGPYNQNEVEVARYNLGSHGFNPRVLQSKSSHFSLPPITLYGTDLTVSDCIITWELNSPEATVEFMQGRNVVATSKGRWEKHDFAFKTNAIASKEEERGPETLLEIQRAGTDQGLVLDGSGLRVYVAR